MKIRVYYEDTDIGGVVYYANYFKFIERARSEIFFENNLSPFSKNSHFVVQKIEASFIRSAKFGDILDVTTKVIGTSSVSITMLQEVLLCGVLLFTATITLVHVGENSKPKRIPNDLLTLLNGYSALD